MYIYLAYLQVLNVIENTIAYIITWFYFHQGANLCLKVEVNEAEGIDLLL